jgi:GNAT superfamily N-acetyltransferase
MLTLRPARPDDAATILELVRALADYERLAHEVDADQVAFERALFGPSPRAFCTLAEWRATSEAAPVAAGMALWFYNFSTFRGRHGIHLEDLFVRPEYRGRGIGKSLLVDLAARCVREGLTRLEWQVLDWNTPALEFYAGLGAEAKAEWVLHRVTGDALKRLGDPTIPGSPAPPRR